MLVIGVILIVVGVILSIPILYTLGILLAVVGAILLALEGFGHRVGGRRWY